MANRSELDGVNARLGGCPVDDEPIGPALRAYEAAERARATTVRVTSESWDGQAWQPLVSEVAGRDEAAEAQGLVGFLDSCDEDERAGYLRNFCSVELGVN